jgi:protoheme IX farnesyltransferase
VPINVRPFVPSRLTRRPGHESGRIPTTVVAGYIALTKPRIIELLLITTIPTMVVANNGWPSLWLMVVTMVGGTLAAGGANAINMVIDRDIDALMDRTKTRPLVTGLIKPRDAMIFALALEAVAFAIHWAGANQHAA